MGRHRTALWGTVLGVALGSAGPVRAAGQADVLPGEAVSTGAVAGRVLDASGAPAGQVTVSLLGLTTLSGVDGSFRFAAVPDSRLTELNVRIVDRNGTMIGCTTLSVPVGFYSLGAAAGERVAVTTASPREGRPVELRLAPVTSTEIDAFCSRCHGANPCAQTQGYGDGGEKPGSLAGIVAREDELESLRENLVGRVGERETFAGLRYRDAHPQAVDMATVMAQHDGAEVRFRLPPTLPLSPDQRLTCDTCHTRHVPTASRSYTRKDFEAASALCEECHL